MDLMGVTRTIDHAVYMILNAIAGVMWRLDAALLSISLFSYGTQDWLTGRDGGIWQVLETMVGANGIFGLATWQAFLILAITLFGLARVARPFLPRLRPVDPGKLFLFGILSYVVISQGSSLMQSVESWRSEAGSYMYEQLSHGDAVDLAIPGISGSTDDLLYAPAELDGNPPLRGWEAVASSYFLVQDPAELHQGVPPRDFRLTYCLYDPGEPIDAQAEENEAGCSPRKAWDEWETITLTRPITQVWGIPLPGSVSIDIPVVQEHPENRQLAIRQAQAGLARLALGSVVALFPLVEANISLMLALAAGFIYLSLPIVLLFGFFMVTEAMATRLLLQLINIILRTLILNGLAALFLMLLMGVSIHGSLTAYLGLVGVGLIGGFILMRFAAGTMKESFSQALGAVGGIWLGATVGTMGVSAAKPARAALGLAKLGATAAMLGAARGRAFDLAEAGLVSARSGLGDINQASPQTMSQMRRGAGRLPAPLARMAQTELAAAASPRQTPPDPAVPLRMVNSGSGRPVSSPNGTDSGRERPPALTPTRSSLSRQAGQAMDRPPIMAPRTASASPGLLPGLSSVPVQPRRLSSPRQPVVASFKGEPRQIAIDRWLVQSYQPHGRGTAREQGRELLGEELTEHAARTLSRRTQAEAQTVLTAARRVQTENKRGAPLIQTDGTLNPAGVRAVHAQLDEKTAQAFSDRQGAQDLAVLSAVAWQSEKIATPAQFRQAVARAADLPGEQSAGWTVPRALTLDPVTTGVHLAGLNRFARLSRQAGLSVEQREQLLDETRQGQVSTSLRRELETALRRQQKKGHKVELKVDDLVAGAAALPETLSGPRRLRLPGGQMAVPPPFSQSHPETDRKTGQNRGNRTAAKRQKNRARPRPRPSKSDDSKNNEPETAIAVEKTGGPA